MAYTCMTCGAVADSPGHLCSPIDASTSCTFCGTETTEKRHVCRDKLAAVQYYCSTCGQVAEERSYLCNPEPIIE